MKGFVLTNAITPFEKLLSTQYSVTFSSCIHQCVALR